MNKKKRILWTISAICMIAACIVTAYLVPERVAAWYDEKTMETVDYTKITYEPYKIFYYDSFAEKMDALCRMNAQMYMLDLGERKDISKDEELVSVVNEELEAVYHAGIMPEPVRVTSIQKRYFYEIYPMAGTTENEVIQNAYIWDLLCETDSGSVFVQLDSEYHKIYSLGIVVDTVQQQAGKEIQEEGYIEQEQLGRWLAVYTQEEKMDQFVQGWLDYWGLQGMSYRLQENPYGMPYDGKKAQDVFSEKVYFIDMPSGWEMKIKLNIYSYAPSGEWSLFAGTLLLSAGQN